MKRRIKIGEWMVLCLFLSGCAGDYLDTAPEDQTGSAVVFETTE